VVTSGTPESTYYVYNGEGDRVRKVTERANGTRKAERIYLDGFERYREYDATGTNVILERQTLHVKDDRRRVALIERRTRGSDGSAALLTRYQLGNHLGSASLELDPDAQVISYEEYTPYGSTSYQGVRAATPSAKRYRYSAKERDAETGLYYYGARYYAPWLCRWTASDPVGIKDGVNTYWSFHDNPVLFVDPDGRDKVPANFVEYASDIESGLNRMAQLGLEDGIEYGLAHDPKTNKLMVLRGTRTEISFGRLTPLGHSHTGNDTTVAPSTADLNEFAKKKVKEHWLFSTEDGWARLRYDAKTKTFDVLLNRGKNAVRLTIMQNPKFNRKDKSPIGQASRWLTTVDDPKGEFEVAPPQSRGSAGPVKAPGISWGRWGMRAVFGVEVAATAVVLWNRYSKIVDADRSANDPTYSRTRQAIQQDVTVGAILTGIATTSPAARRGIGAAGNFFLAMEVGKLIFGEDDTIREDPMTGREIRWIYVDDPQVKGMKIGTPHVIDSKTKQWAPAIMSGPGWYTQRELDEMNDPWR
jgi:RHS repeat-associated protein